MSRHDLSAGLRKSETATTLDLRFAKVPPNARPGLPRPSSQTLTHARGPSTRSVPLPKVTQACPESEVAQRVPRTHAETVPPQAAVRLVQ